MSDPTTSNIQLAVPTHGSDVDTWDEPLNNNANILDAAFGSVTSKALTNVNVTLTATEAQSSTIRLSGALTGNVTINVSAIIKSWYIDNLTTGAFVVLISGGSGNVVGVPQGETVQVYWDGTNCKFINLDRVGSYWDYAGASVPAWVTACSVPPYLTCNGTSFSAVTYPYLNSLLGTTTLPDFRGRTRFYLNDGTNRITTAASGIDGDTRFDAGGAQTQTLTTSQIPAHSHTASVSDPGHAHNLYETGIAEFSGSARSFGGSAGTLAGSTATATTGISVSNANTGGGGAHNNMPPATIGGITMIRAA